MLQGTLDSKVFSLMQTGQPYKRYIKTILGKVYVNVLNPFSGKQEGRILVGNPRRKDEDCVIEIWSEMEDAFFKRTNKKHFETGNIREFREAIKTTEVKSPNLLTEEEVDEILSMSNRFLALQSKVNQLTTIAPVSRLLERAKELDKSQKIVSFLESKLSEIQAKEYSSPEIK